mmetsp:Transcript_34550/g.39133  ORF Transcript_34550/g.39133 Transcript_34550/m.39133 type:complete len:185 (-) Transcript_34550:327-881(-)
MSSNMSGSRQSKNSSFQKTFHHYKGGSSDLNSSLMTEKEPAAIKKYLKSVDRNYDRESGTSGVKRRTRWGSSSGRRKGASSTKRHVESVEDHENTSEIGISGMGSSSMRSNSLDNLHSKSVTSDNRVNTGSKKKSGRASSKSKRANTNSSHYHHIHHRHNHHLQAGADVSYSSSRASSSLKSNH